MTSRLDDPESSSSWTVIFLVSTPGQRPRRVGSRPGQPCPCRQPVVAHREPHRPVRIRTQDPYQPAPQPAPPTAPGDAGGCPTGPSGARGAGNRWLRARLARVGARAAAEATARRRRAAYLEDQSVAQTADILGCSTSAAKTHLARGRGALLVAARAAGATAHCEPAGATR